MLVCKLKLINDSEEWLPLPTIRKDHASQDMKEFFVHNVNLDIHQLDPINVHHALHMLRILSE